MAESTREPVKSEKVYTVFREAAVNEAGTYATQLSDKFDSDRTDFSRILSNLESLNILKKGKRGKAQFYEVNTQKLPKLQNSFFQTDLSIEEEFLASYVNLYTRFHKDSTLIKMLRDDFVTIFSSYSKFNEIPEFLEEFLDTPEAEAFDSRHMEIAETVLGDDNGV